MSDVARPCPFCERLNNGEYTPGADQGVMRFEPLNPVTPGHMLFMPKAHHSDAAKLPHVTGFVFAEAARWASIQHEPFNLITSAGSEATQSVPHLHVHYVPRHAGDGLALPWTNQVPAATSPVPETQQ